MSFYESSSDEETGLLKKALDIKISEDFDPTKVPLTGIIVPNKWLLLNIQIEMLFVLPGEEYVQYVMYERKQCKKWLTVDIDRTKFKKKPSLGLEEVSTNN